MKRDETTCKKMCKKMWKGSKSAMACLFAMALLANAPMPAAAQQFSADLLARKDDTATAMGTLRVSGGKARIDSTALPDALLSARYRQARRLFRPPGSACLYEGHAIERAHPAVFGY